MKNYPRYFMNLSASDNYICHAVFKKGSRPIICYLNERSFSYHRTIKELIGTGMDEIAAPELALMKGTVPISSLDNS